MLTRKQRDLLTFIETRLATEGVCPSYEEMMHATGLKAKSGIHRLVLALEERGVIRRLPNRNRAIELVNPLAQFTSAQLTAELARRSKGTLSLPVAA